MPESLLAWVRLLRLPNHATAVADVLAGYLIVSQSRAIDWPAPALWWAILASLGFYAAGMVLNDVFDLALDREERPERPLPSGRISVRSASAAGNVLMAIGSAAACATAFAAHSPWPALVGALLTAAVWTYNRHAKATSLGPAVMGSCRSLNWLLGMTAAGGPHGPHQWLLPIGMGVYVMGITVYARDEAEESRSGTLAAGMLIMLIGLATATFGLARHAMLTTYVPLAYRARSLSLLGGSLRAGAVVGPLLSAGLIATTNSPHAAFWLTAIGTVATIIVVFFLADPEKVYGAPSLVTENDGRVVTAGEDEIERESHGIFGTMWSNRGVLLRLGTASGITGALRATRAVLLPLWAISIGMHDAQIALVIGIATAIDFALFFFSGQVMDRWGRRWSAVPAMVIMSGSIILLSFTHDLTSHVTWFIACAMILALGNGLASGLLLTLGSDLAPRANPASFLGAFRLTIDLGSSAAPLGITLITAIASLSVAAGALGVVGLAGAYMMWRYIPRYIPWHPPARRAPSVRG
jgi:4-hydroxybenzoate polyprenyltransferase